MASCTFWAYHQQIHWSTWPAENPQHFQTMISVYLFLGLLAAARQLVRKTLSWETNKKLFVNFTSNQSIERLADLNPSQWVSYNSSTGSIIPGWTAENHFEATSWPSAGAPILCISVVKGMRTTVVLICFDRMFLFLVPSKHKMTQARDFLNVPRMRWWCSLQIMFNAPHVGPNKNSKPN